MRRRVKPWLSVCFNPKSAIRNPQSGGQASLETALIMAAVLIPLTFGFWVVAEAAWTYHSLVLLTRQGARYAATHCWTDSSGSNVVQWMVTHAPPFIDRQQLGGTAQIQVNYWTHDMTTDPLNPATVSFLPGDGCGSCMPGCQPDSVTVSISGYQFSHLVTTIGMQPIQVPGFATTVEVQSLGGDADTYTGVSSP